MRRNIYGIFFSFYARTQREIACLLLFFFLVMLYYYILVTS